MNRVLACKFINFGAKFLGGPKFARTLATSSHTKTMMASEGDYADEGADVEMVSISSSLPPPNQKERLAGAQAKQAKKQVKAGTPSVEEIYQKKTQLEHIILRPDTYIGSVERQAQSMYVMNRATGRMEQREISFVPGLFKIFDEILVNAADNKVRDPQMDTLRVDICREEGKISVLNNGRGIPIEMHKKEGVWVPELIFGHLLTSSNYDDSQRKVTGGRNGYGAKLCNIFSTKFVVETADGKSKYKQTFSNNMAAASPPQIGEARKKEEYTKITFWPDFSKFGMPEGMDDDIVSLFERRVHDIAGCIAGIKVFLGGERIKVKTFKQYCELFTAPPPRTQGDEDGGEEGEKVKTSFPAAQSPAIVWEKFGGRWEVCVMPSDGQFSQMSFVNSICTHKGGTHVAYITDQITASLLETIKKKNKDLKSLKPFQIKSHLFVFVNCLIENPTFDSQTKEMMTLRASSFGSKCALSDDFIKKIIKSGVIESVVSWARFKQSKELKKTDGSKKTRLQGIAKLDDANNAGTKNGAKKCTLIVTEGDSAKALAVSGLSVVGRDDYGVFPLRGKLLNVREASHKQIMDNAEINHIKQILGLQHGKQYASTEGLRYGHLMIMTDQDHDGSHIKGLLINFFDHFFPSLLKIPNFLIEFITPIVKVSKAGGSEKAFYTLPEYEAWREEQEREGRGLTGWTIKYYKGLGTSTAADAKKYFSHMEMHRKAFDTCSEDERKLVDMAFNKKRADERKEWLRSCRPGTHIDHSTQTISIADFINKELILFSMADNQRSIPSAIDGLKPGQRKILFSAFKRNLKSEIKVAQLAGYVSEHSAYHHGEQSLCSTIVGMAQDYVGSNNVALLQPNGQFGTRLQGGKDAASPRYIFTLLSKFARLLFCEHDDALLEYQEEDGQKIEPTWYCPIIPLVLVNGGEGIGTGWMTSIPTFNPVDIIANVRRLMAGSELEVMHPWYRGFTGTIEDCGEGRYKATGVWEKIDNETIEISELPIGTWTQTYKEYLESLRCGTEKVQPFIKDYKEYHTDTKVKFIVSLSPACMQAAEREGIDKKLKLSTLINLNNLVCFTEDGLIKKYDNVLGILQDHYHLRLSLYVKRKQWLSDQLNKQWCKLDNKCRFIREIISNKIVIRNTPKSQLIQQLDGMSFVKFDGSFDYLLTMSISSLTAEKILELEGQRAEKERELDELLKRSPKDLWNHDLDLFLEEWSEYVQRFENVDADDDARARSGKGKRAKTTAIKPSKRAVAPRPADPLPLTAKISQLPPKKAKIAVEESVSSAKLTPEQISNLPLTERINYMLNLKVGAGAKETLSPSVNDAKPPTQTKLTDHDHKFVKEASSLTENNEIKGQARQKPLRSRKGNVMISSDDERDALDAGSAVVESDAEHGSDEFVVSDEDDELFSE